MLSFVLSGIGLRFCGTLLCGVRLHDSAGRVSAYTYGYATLGELFAWIIGWDLTLEYALGASTVSSGWSNHFIEFLRYLRHSRCRCGWPTITGPGCAWRKTSWRGRWPAQHPNLAGPGHAGVHRRRLMPSRPAQSADCCSGRMICWVRRTSLRHRDRLQPAGLL